MDPGPDSEIRTLLCHAHVPMALRCFASLFRCHQAPFRLIIHDDGTLTDEDCARLLSLRADTIIVPRAEADGPVRAALARYPACLRYRDRHPLGLKLFDVPLLAGEKRFAYCDSDIYYLRPFDGFDRAAQAATVPFVFTRDIGTEYALRYFHVLGPRRIPFISRLNSGIIGLERAKLDLDFLEFLLAQLDQDTFPGLVEQTCWAALAARAGGCRFLSPLQINYPLPGRGQPDALASVPAERVALHFVSPLRSRLSWLDEEKNRPDPAPTVQLATIPARQLTAPAYLWSRAGKEWRRWRWKYGR